MRIVHLSYANMTDYSDPNAWLKRIDFFAVLLEQMAKEVEVKSIHCLNFTGVLNRNGVEYHFIKPEKLSLFSPDVNEYVRKLNVDVVIVHGFHFPIKVLWLKWKLGAEAKIIIQHHAEKPLRHYKSFLQRFVDKVVSAYFFTSLDQSIAWLADRQIGDRSKIYEVMEVPSVFKPMDRSEARAVTKVGVLKNYLWVGRFDQNKDPITLINAFIPFAKKNNDVHLYVVFQSNELINEVLKLIKEAKAERQITLVGKVEHHELLYWYNSIDFIISTSHYEGSGIAVCEGMSCGCIPILTNIPSFRMMTNNGDCGLLFNAGDQRELASALQKSLAMDIGLNRKKTLTLYQENLSPEAIAGRMINCCKNVVTRKG